MIDYDDVYKLLQRIPRGRVSTYGDLAKALGHPASSRIIGKIVSKNPNPIIIPCHRIVTSKGELGGYAFGPKMKKVLLEKEGIIFKKNLVIHDFAKVRFTPIIESSVS